MRGASRRVAEVAKCSEEAVFCQRAYLCLSRENSRRKGLKETKKAIQAIGPGNILTLCVICRVYADNFN